MTSVNAVQRKAAKVERVIPPHTDPKEITALVPIDFAALTGRKAPPQEWIWKGWIPYRRPTLLHGYGGSGKTLLAQMICTASVTGRNLFGAEVRKGPALLFAGEDDHDELWRRQESICEAWGLTFADLSGLTIIPAPDMDITIAEVDENGAVKLTPMHGHLQRIMTAINPQLAMFDNAAQLFAASENSRRAVTVYMAVIRELCAPTGCTPVVLDHDNKLGTFSGSTGKENAVRSRLHLKRPDDDTDIIELIKGKINYGKPGEGTLRLKWNRGCFHSADEAVMTQAERLEANMRRRDDAQVFLTALDKFTREGRNLSHSDRASNYAPKLIVATKRHKGRSIKQLADAMDMLLDEGQLVANAVTNKGKDRHSINGLARCGTVQEAREGQP